MNHSFPLYILIHAKEIEAKRKMGSRNDEREDRSFVKHARGEDQLVDIDHAGFIIETVLNNVNFDCGNLVCNSTTDRISTCQSTLEGDLK